MLLTTEEKKYLDDLKNKIPTGNAILFVGAGFSKGASSIDDQNLCLAKELANEIAILIDHKINENDKQEVDDLMYMSDLLLQKPHCIDSFIKSMQNKFTIRDTTTDQQKICALPWKRFYTTNYDDTVQQASRKIGKFVATATKRTRLGDVKEPYILHINGDINELNKKTLSDEFKLTESSYISMDSFINTPWKYIFSRDIEYAPAVVFIGYSLYDFEIKKILMEYNDTSKNRIYFITSQTITDRNKHTLSKFGNVIPIGVEGFASWIDENKENLISISNIMQLKCFIKYSYQEDRPKTIIDKDILSFLMLGKFQEGYIEDALIDINSTNAIIFRDRFDSVLDEVKLNKHIVITSELGNGKSIYLQCLAFLISRSLGGDIYFLPENLSEYDNPIQDIDYLKNNNKTNYLFLDNYSKYFDIIEYISKNNIANIVLLASSRNSSHEKMLNQLSELIEYSEYNIDILTEKEIDKFISIIDYLGYWGELINNLDQRSKMKFIKEKNNSLLSSVLLSLLKSENIKNKIKELIGNLLDKKDFKEIIFVICLLNLLEAKSDFFSISTILNNNNIYNSSIRENIYFKEVVDFNKRNNSFTTHSSVFSLSFISDHYEASYIVYKLVEIVKRLNDEPVFDREMYFLKKKILRFSFIERIIPEKNKKNSLNLYYDLLKQEIDWIKYDPHYWLQYAMAQITLNDYTAAQMYLTQAYNLAKNKVDYNTNYIDTQQARLYLKLSLLPDKSFDFFLKGHSLFLRIPNDFYRHKQLDVYQKFYENKFSVLSKKDKVTFEQACKKMLSDIEKSDGLQERIYFISNIKKMFENIIADIAHARAV